MNSLLHHNLIPRGVKYASTLQAIECQVKLSNSLQIPERRHGTCTYSVLKKERLCIPTTTKLCTAITQNYDKHIFVKCFHATRAMFQYNDHLHASPTIYALSSGHGKCGVAVIRVSGSRSGEVILKLCGKESFQRRKAVLSRIYDPETSDVLDKGLVLWFPGPHSFTGEDSCELHVHGGVAVISAVMSALDKLPGLRPADAGEFTQRAFQNGKLDLTEVEGLGDLIHAETESQRKQALRQMEGELSKFYTRWRQELMKCVADVEAFIDFSEDDNIEDGILDEVETRVTSLITNIDQHLKDNRQGERLRDGVHIAIIGKPNVGKSSLLNLICQRPAAIVSPIAGTTRDIVETALNINGYPVLLSDTAGLRETTNEVEKEGVRRALQRGEQTDIQIIVLDGEELCKYTTPGQDYVPDQLIDSYMTSLGFSTSTNHNSQERILVINKTDLVASKDIDLMVGSFSDSCSISCLTENGVDNFMEVLADKVKNMCANPSAGNPSLTQARHRSCLTKCLAALHDFLDVMDSDIVIGAHELRKALRQLGKITGKITSEEILDVIFRDFCIGK